MYPFAPRRVIGSPSVFTHVTAHGYRLRRRIALAHCRPVVVPFHSFLFCQICAAVDLDADDNCFVNNCAARRKRGCVEYNEHRCRRIAASGWLLQLLPHDRRGIALLLLLRLPCVMSVESSRCLLLIPFHAYSLK
jgi:hypothetical protein